MDLQLREDQHYDATKTQRDTKGTEAYASEEVHEATEEGDEQVGAITAEEPGEDSDEEAIEETVAPRTHAEIKRQLKTARQMVDRQFFTWKWVVYADVFAQVKAEGVQNQADLERRTQWIWKDQCFPLDIYHTPEGEEGTQAEFLCNWLQSGQSWAKSKARFATLSLSAVPKREVSPSFKNHAMERLRENAARTYKPQTYKPRTDATRGAR